MKKHLCIIILIFSLLPIQLLAKTIKGTVFSATDSLALAGANVIAVRADATLIKAATANAEGRFALDIAEGSQCNLVISFTGFVSKQIQIDGLKNDMNLGKVYLLEDVQQLGEVVVQGQSVVSKVDKSIIIPTATLLRTSNSSLRLLQNMNLSGLRIDPIEQTVSINGAEPMYMINGVIKTKQEILTINPKDIARIEYEDMQSIRTIDREVGGVINIILKERETGGSFWGDVLGSPVTGFLNTDMGLTYSYKKSEFSFTYSNNLREYTHRTTDKEEKFIAPGHELSRDFVGVNSPFGYLDQFANLGYTYQHDANTMFSATLRNSFGNQHTSVNGNVIDSQMDEPYYRYSKNTFRSYSPALDLYFRRRFKNKQSIEINVVGTLIDANYKRNLKDGEDGALHELHNRIEDTKRSVISEVVYKKEFEKVTLNLGYQNKISSSENKYAEEASVKEKLTDNNNYLYAGLSGALSKFSYSLGTGVKVLTVKDNTDKRTFVKNQSTLNLMYAPTNEVSFRLSSYYTPTLPSLSSLSAVTQTYDDVLKMSGNPDLKAAHTLGSKLTASYSKGKFNSNLLLTLQRRFKTIYSDVRPLDDGTFIQHPFNAINDDLFYAEWKGSYQGLFNHINLSATVGHDSYVARGEDYKHHLDGFYWNAAA